MSRHVIKYTHIEANGGAVTSYVRLTKSSAKKLGEYLIKVSKGE